MPKFISLLIRFELEFLLGIAAFDSFQEEIAKKNICLSQQYKLQRNADDSKFKYIVSSMEREASSNGK